MIPAAIASAFDFQSRACSDLGSAFMGQLMRLCATQDWPESPVTDRIFHWQGDISPRGQSVPLRLAGALHALRLMGNATLDAVYPPAQVQDADLWQAIARVLVTESGFICDWLDSAPQTNEVRRSAVLIALGHWLTARYGLPIRTSELGASAGLNLQWNQYALRIGDNTFGPSDPVLTLHPDWTGPLPPHNRPNVVEHSGVDINPLDPAKDALRLEAYLWPDQPHRLSLTRSAISAAHTPVAQGDAIDWLAHRLPHQSGQLHLIYSTVAWQYFPADKQTQGTAMIQAAGETASTGSPLAWFGMETDGAQPGAALTLRLWPEDITIPLGRADFHGRWVDWLPA